MRHAPNPIYENRAGRTTISFVFTILITGGLFLLIPLTQLSSKWFACTNPPASGSTYYEKPPMWVEPFKPEKKPKDPDEKIELKPDFVPVTIRTIDHIMEGVRGRGINIPVGSWNPEDFPEAELIYEPEQLDVSPRVMLSPAPAYPQMLKRNKVEGSVAVEFIVTIRGTVRDIKITEATHREFVDSVRRALKRWSFKPGRLNDKPVNTRVRQVFHFHLR